MNLLGLDLSLSASGVAYLEDGKLSESYVVRCGHAGETDIKRYSDAAAAILSLCVDGGVVGFGTPRVDLVAIEDVYADRNLNTYKRLAQLSAVVQYLLHRNSIPVTILTPSEWRKACFGKVVQKEQIRLLMERRYRGQLNGLDLETADLNALEATCVAIAAHRIASGEYTVEPSKRRRTASAAAAAASGAGAGPGGDARAQGAGGGDGEAAAEAGAGRRGARGAHR